MDGYFMLAVESKFLEMLVGAGGLELSNHWYSNGKRKRLINTQMIQSPTRLNQNQAGASSDTESIIWLT